MNDLYQLYESEKARISSLAEKKDAPQADYQHPVFGIGNECPKLMIVGEAPGKEEAAAGIPFVGKAGKQLDAFLEDAGIEREKIFVTNTVKYRTLNRKEKSVSNRTPSKKEIVESLPVLIEEIRLICPKIIATFGNTPLFALQYISKGKIPFATIGELHGREISFHFNNNRIILFPMYHPASVIYNRTLKSILEEDTFKLAKLTFSLI